MRNNNNRWGRDDDFHNYNDRNYNSNQRDNWGQQQLPNAPWQDYGSGYDTRRDQGFERDRGYNSQRSFQGRDEDYPRGYRYDGDPQRNVWDRDSRNGWDHQNASPRDHRGYGYDDRESRHEQTRRSQSNMDWGYQDRPVEGRNAYPQRNQGRSTRRDPSDWDY